MTAAAGEGLPWRRLMGLGLGVLRLTPQAFWAMTPKELDAAAGGLMAEAGVPPFTRAELAALMQRYPDARG